MLPSDVVLETLAKLSISPKVVSHEPVTNASTWTEALKTEDASSFELTKTLILKPKTAKTAPVTPVVVIALESTETNATALGKKLSLKDCRFANEELLSETFGATKENVSPFSLSHVQDLSLIHLVLDAALPANTPLAFHPNAAEQTVFVTVEELKKYLESIGKEFVEIDFKALAAAKPTGEKKPAAGAASPKAPKAKKEGKVLNRVGGKSINARGSENERGKNRSKMSLDHVRFTRFYYHYSCCFYRGSQSNGSWL
jgi:prolyl-tRNA synthetase